MADLVTSINKLGSNLHLFLTSANALYVIYFFAFLFTTYVLMNTALQKGGKNPFRGKPGKVLSLMIAFIVTGAVFYGKSATALILTFNNVGGFVFTLFFAGAFVGLGVWLFRKYKKDNFNLAMFCVSFFTYIGSSLMLPHFLVEIKNLAGETQILYGAGGAIIFGQGGIAIKNTLATIIDFSFFLLVIFGFMLVFSFFFGGEVKTPLSSITKDKKSDEHKKRISDFKTLLNALMEELKDANNHFYNKVNLLNDLRVEIAKLKNIDKKGGER